MEPMTPALEQYFESTFGDEDETLRGILRRMSDEGLPMISIGPAEGRFLALMVAAVGARRALEIGTLAGYSGVWIARALPADGRLVTIEYNPAHAAVAADEFARAGLAERVEIRQGRALEVLGGLDGESFDLVFIDADKEGYPAYLEWAVRHTRPGGAIVAHNAYLAGDVVADDGTDRVRGMRAYLERIATDRRLQSTVLPLRDGMAVSIVRPGGGA
jgi:caffeoyl-CoA O-methyltransferase